MTFPVKGIETVDEKGDPYVRRDIDKWYAEQVDEKGNRVQLTLFMRALALIQRREVKEELSFFRLAAIHSAPWCEWDGVPQPPDKPPNDPERIRGYCVHNDYTFPTWHRVYMMLYERTLYDAMYEWIGGNVPAKLQSTWKKEADQWRLPYWDFARKADRPPSTDDASKPGFSDDILRLPILCMMPNVRITVFNKGDPALESIPNPLYKYVMDGPMGDLPHDYKIIGEEQKGFTYPWDKCSATTKYGILDGFDASIWADGGQNWLRSNYALNEHAYYDNSGFDGERDIPTVQDLINRLFTYGLDHWGAFSSSRYTSPHPEAPKQDGSAAVTLPKLKLDEKNVKNAMNLEFIHNNIHNFVGGTQFLRPDKEHIQLWGAGHMSSVHMAAFDPIFWIYHNNIDRLTAIWQSLNWEKWFDDVFSQGAKNDQLRPFHKDSAGTFWKSDDVREWQKLGYDYEILKGRGHGEEHRKEILDDVNSLYGRPVQNRLDKLPTGPDGENDDYVITVIYDKFALNGAPYKINLFLDETEASSDEKFRGPESEGFVASIYNFSGSLNSSPCGNCEKQKSEGVKCIAQVPATIPMRSYWSRKERSPDHKLQPVYLAWNNFGTSVKMDIEVAMHKSSRAYYQYPTRPEPGHPLSYDHIATGRQSALAGTSFR